MSVSVEVCLALRNYSTKQRNISRSEVGESLCIAGEQSIEARGAEFEARRAESGDGVLGEEAASPLPTSYRGYGSAVSSPCVVWGGAPTEIEFGAFYP